jgi:hypothetical protein
LTKRGGTVSVERGVFRAGSLWVPYQADADATTYWAYGWPVKADAVAALDEEARTGTKPVGEPLTAEQRRILMFGASELRQPLPAESRRG